MVGLCTGLCSSSGFVNHDYIKGSKYCKECDLYLVTQSFDCACCKNKLEAPKNIETVTERWNSFRRYGISPGARFL